MIPKVIHYCWFSGDKYPPIIKYCLDSWKKILPDYEFRLWDSLNTIFDIPFAQKAFQEKKWAFLTDYIRMKILYEEGGIFLDTDVFLIKSFDDLLNYDSFWNFADNGMIEPVVIGAEKKNFIIKECKNMYERLTYKDLHDYKYIEIPKIITPVFKKYGINTYNEQSQFIKNNIILSHYAFCSMPFKDADISKINKFITKDSYAVHLWNAAWFEDEFRFFWNNRWKKGWNIVLKKILNNPFRPLSYYKNLMYHLVRNIKIILNENNSNNL